jgi:hypothetical protein
MEQGQSLAELRRASRHRPSQETVLAAEGSAAQRDMLVAELAQLDSAELAGRRRSLPSRTSSSEADARLVEEAFGSRDARPHPHTHPCHLKQHGSLFKRFVSDNCKVALPARHFSSRYPCSQQMSTSTTCAKPYCRSETSADHDNRPLPF